MSLAETTLLSDLEELEGVLAVREHTHPSEWVEVAFESGASESIERLADQEGLTLRSVGLQGSDLAVGSLREVRP